MKRIVVLGSANGSRNLGDECMWEALASFLKSEYMGVEIVTDALPGWNAPFGNVQVLPMLSTQMKIDPFKHPGLSKAINRSSLTRALSRFGRDRRVNELVQDRVRNGPRTDLEKEWFDAIESSDGFFISGAGGITDQYSVHGIFSWLLLTKWASISGVPTFAVGQGVGPVEAAGLKQPARDLLMSLDHIEVRETKSKAVVENLTEGVISPRVTLDWALGIQVDSSDRDEADQILKSYFENQESFIALSLHLHQPLAFRRRKALEKLVRELAKTAKGRGLRILFIPNMTGDGHSDDRALADQLISKVPAEDRNVFRVHRGQSDARIVRALLGRAAGLLATRYHPLVFSLTEGRPAIGLYFDDYYVQKLSGASEKFEVYGNIHSVDTAIEHPGKMIDLLEKQQVNTFTAQQIEDDLFIPLGEIISKFKRGEH